MSKIVFINSINVESTTYQIPLGILSLASIIKTKNYDVDIIDFNYLWINKYCKKGTTMQESIEIMYSYIEKYKPSIVGFYCMCDSYHIAIMLSKYLKEKNHDIKIMFGGPQASLTSKITLEKFPWIDVVGIGEGESTIESIIKALEANSSFDSISSVTYRKNGAVFTNSEQTLLENLDNLPYLDYTLINIEDYKCILIDAGRGCPFGCSYCSTKTFWERKYRLKSPYRLVKEIKYLKEEFNKSEFELVHDLFTLKKSNVIEFCNLIIKENLNIQWGCSARIDTLDEEMILKMKEAGCGSIFIGIETGSQRMQKIINKNLNINRVYSVIDILNKYKFKVTTSFIYGFENETYEDIEETLNVMNFCMKKGCKILINLCTVFVGTELYENVKNNLEFVNKYSLLTQVKDITYCEGIIKENPEIFPNFYTFRSQLRTDLEFMDIFITYLYVFLYKGFKNTYDFLMEYYDNSVLNFYIGFMNIVPDFTKELFDKSKTNLVLSRLDLLQKFINEVDFNDKSGIIRDIFKFESNVIRLQLTDNFFEITCSFKYNIVKIKTFNLDMKDAELDPVIIKLYKNENKKIQAQVLSL